MALNPPSSQSRPATYGFAPGPMEQSRLSGRLDPEGGAPVLEVLKSLNGRRAPADGVPDPRSPARRNADALVEAMSSLLDEAARRWCRGGGLLDGFSAWLASGLPLGEKPLTGRLTVFSIPYDVNFTDTRQAR